MAAILDIRTERFSNSEYVAPMPPVKFQLNPSYGLEGMSFEDFQDG